MVGCYAALSPHSSSSDLQLIYRRFLHPLMFDLALPYVCHVSDAVFEGMVRLCK